MKSGLLLLLALAFLAGCAAGGGAEPVLTDNQKAADYNASLGETYMRGGDIKEAREKLSKAIAQDPHNPRANFFYAIFLNRIDDFSGADKYFAKAVALDPENIEYSSTYGAFLCEQGLLDRALVQFQHAVDNPYNETPAISHWNIGSCALQHDDLDTAEKHFRAALRLDPQYGEALLSMSDVLLRRGKTQIAYAYYERYLQYQTDPDTASSLWVGIRIYDAIGSKRRADILGTQLKVNFPTAKETLLYLNLRL